MNKEQLKKILQNHTDWLNDRTDGVRANLSGENLRGIDFSGVDLSEAILSGADLTKADLSKARLSWAILSGARLPWANLSKANLLGANLSGADLSEADLSGANLSQANLSVTDLFEVNLSGTNLLGANLSGANLSRAKLSETIISGANLSNANPTDTDLDLKFVNRYFPLCCPESGAFIGWKKAGNKIVKLQITEDAKRSSAYGRKCRCNKAIVLAIENLDGSASGIIEIPSDYTAGFVYRIGETVQVLNFDEDRRKECSTGIHFFITRQEAVEY